MPGRFRTSVVLPLLCLLPHVAYGDDVDEYIDKSMVRQHIPGLSLLVLHNGEIIKAKGYGRASLEHRAAARPETVYDLASTTKPFVATAVMLLVQEEKMGLDDPIGQFVDNVPDAWQSITVRHLLSHTSGIKDYLGDLRHDFPQDTPPEPIVRAAMEAPLNFRPGERWSYSNTGYVLLGMIVRRVSGNPYDVLLHERIFEPLGMTATRHNSPDEVIPNRAAGYLWNGPGGLRNGDFLKYLMTNHGDRGLVSTALDLAKWDAALDTDKILSASSKGVMWTPAQLSNGKRAGYGLGWFVDQVNGHRHVHHAGGAPGTATIIARYPDDRLTVIILTNGGAAYIQGLEFGVAQRYVPGLVSRTVVALQPGLLESYTGYYNAFGSQLLKVTREDNALVVDDDSRLVNAFVPLSETQFEAEDADRGFTLTRAADGGVTGMTLRLIQDRMAVPRVGPLFSSLEAGPDPDPRLTRRVRAVLDAFAVGGKAVEEVDGVAPQARQDYARGPSPELAGIKDVSFIAMRNVSDRRIERHGGKVARVLYYRLLTDGPSRNVLIYLTADGLITDQDVVAK